MKKLAKSLIVMMLVVSLLMSNFAMMAMASYENYSVEIAFNNAFVLDKWASNVLSTTIIAEGQPKADKLGIDIENGTVVFKNAYAGEAYTAFSMDPTNPTVNLMYYNMEVESGTVYTFAYNLTQNAGGVVPYVFYFDKDHKYIDLDCAFASTNGDQSFDFTTPANCHYIQMRLTLAGTGTATFKNIFISKKIPGATNTGYDHRRVYTYSKTNPVTYGTLPVPTDVPAGCVFAGWYTGVNGTGERITENTVVKHSSFAVYPKYDPAVDSLSIKTNAAKTEYAVGDRVNLTGLVLEAKAGNVTQTLDSGFYCTPEYLTQTGTQAVTVHYGGRTATYTVNVSTSVSKSIVFNGSAINVGVANHVYQIHQMVNSTFNHYELTYYSDSYVKGIIKYQDSAEEVFFLEPSSNFNRADGNGEFSSYVDGYLDKVLSAEQVTAKVTSNPKSGIQTISFELLDNKAGNFELLSISTSIENAMNPEMTGDAIMASTLKLFSNDQYSVGIDILNGGVVAYLSVINSNIEARVYNIDGQNVTKVDYADKLDAKYGTNYISRNNNVNLINYNDTGRYLQQSYYGTGQKPYEQGYYNNADWNYNPVQGGNVVGEASKVIDFEINEEENYIYVKARPLDWAKWSDDFADLVSNDKYERKYGNEEYVTDTYVEAKYVFEDGMIKVYNRMVDYSGLPSATTTQELPAFYTIEPLNQYVRTDLASDADAWNFNAGLKYDSEPEFWGVTEQSYLDEFYPDGFAVDTHTPEHWGAFMASQDKDSFGIGVYSAETTELFYGVYPPKYAGVNRHAQTNNPAFEPSTSYIAPVGTRTFESYSPSEYSYYITTGTANQIRNSFGAVDNAEFKEELEAQMSLTQVVVPETVYMAPSTGNSKMGQYYVNNTIDISTNTVNLEQSNNKTVGYVQLYIPDAKSVTYDVKYISGANVGDVVASGEGTAHKFDANGYLALNSTTISVTTGLAATNTATAEWKFTVTMNNGLTRTYYAYTTLYAPYIVPYGAALRVVEHATPDPYVQTISWISGVHSIKESTNTDRRKRPNYVTSSTGKYGMLGFLGADNTAYVGDTRIEGIKGAYGDMYAVYASTNTQYSYFWAGQSGSGLDGDGKGSKDWFENSSNLGVYSFEWYNQDRDTSSKYLSALLYTSASGNITIDASRYTNLNQIPNLGAGLMCTDNDSGKKAAWYVADFSDTYTYGKVTDYWQKNKSDSTKYYSEHGTILAGQYNHATDYDSSLNSSYATTGLKYAGSWNRALKSGTSATYSIKTFFGTDNGNGSNAISYAFIDLNATQVDKATLRDLVLQGASFSENNYTPESWAPYKNALAAAGEVLGNPTATATQITTAYNNLKTNRDNLGTFVYFHTGVETGTVNGLDNVTIGNGTALAILGIGGNTRWEFQADYTGFYAIRNDGTTHYTFMGWSISPDTDYRDTDKYYTQNFSADKFMSGGFNQNFYAVWKEHSYTVKFDANGGSNTVADKTVTYTESFVLPSVENCVREGYKLIGWSKTKPSQFSASPEYVPGQTVSGLTDTDGATVTLYAVWAENAVNAVDDTVVVEYGLPVEINVLKNDVSAQDVTAIGTYAEKTGDVKSTTRAFTGTSLELENGNVVLANGKITYTPTTTNTTAQDFYYEVTANGGYYYAKVTVIPATSVYYEDTFFKFTDATITKDDETFNYNWTTVGEVFDAFQSNELDEAYGYDSAYDNNVAYSGGAAHVTTVDKNVTAAVGPTATFTFTGTGFDLFTVTDYYSGMVTATVYSGAQVNAANRVQGVMANAYFGYEYNAETEEYEPADNGAIYQVPIIKARDLAYGTYTVVVAPRYNKSFDITGAGNCKVYVDSVRIYDPMGDGSQIADDVYMADGEYAPEYLNIRDTIVQANNDGIFETLGIGSSVYLDGGNADIENYLKNGPKNEVYLGKGNSVAFNIVTRSNIVPATIQLGMRITGINGTTADVKLTNGNSSQWIRNITLNSTTERYYSIDSAVDWIMLDDGTFKTATPIIITNNSDAIISLTSLKWAFDGTGAQTELYLMSDDSVPEVAMMAIGRAVETEIYDTILNPDNISFSFSENGYTVGDSGVLTIATEQGVAAVTVNGADAISNGTDENGKMLWTYEFTADATGEMTFEIIASDESGLASEPVCASTEVKAEETAETPDVEEPDNGEEPDAIEDTSDDDCWFTKIITFIRNSFNDIINIIKMVINFVMGGVTV